MEYKGRKRRKKVVRKESEGVVLNEWCDIF